ncbi:MAG: hypothetical protein SFW09_12620 [Hyphomicrobiaceae bacterium]|nr:hypothetical protein [Hyphomicrobiaceae bacterium]
MRPGKLAATPAIHQSIGRPVLADLTIEHGPVTLLGRFFLLADGLLAEAGVTLYRTTLAEAAAAQSANVDSWNMFPPMLDTRLSAIPDATSYGLLGRNERGDVVCAQGGRIYDLGDRSFADIVADQSFFYGTEIPPAPGKPTAEVAAPSAPLVRGRMVYSGALWVRPDYRGKNLSGVLPRFSRCYALAKWNTDFTVGMVSESNIVPKLLAAYGYNRIEPRFTIHNLAPTSLSWALLLMRRDELVEDLTGFVDSRSAQIDAAVGDGRAQDQARLVADRNG